MRMRNVSVANWKANREASTETFGFIEERLAGREDVRTNAAQPYVLKGFLDHMWTWFRVRVKTAVVDGFVSSTSVLIYISGGVALPLAVGSYLYYEGSITIGTVFLIYQYTRHLIQPISRVAHEMESLQRAGASVIRIDELLGTKQEVTDGRGVRFPEGPLAVRLIQFPSDTTAVKLSCGTSPSIFAQAGWSDSWAGREAAKLR